MDKGQHEHGNQTTRARNTLTGLYYKWISNAEHNSLQQLLDETSQRLNFFFWAFHIIMINFFPYLFQLITSLIQNWISWLIIISPVSIQKIPLSYLSYTAVSRFHVNKKWIFDKHVSLLKNLSSISFTLTARHKLQVTKTHQSTWENEI